MKRIFAIALCFVVLLTNAVLPVCAEEADNDLLSKACAVFPEYASKMLGTTSSEIVAAYTADPKAVVVNETRAVADSEYLTYTEYADGQIILTGVSSDNPFVYNKTINSYTAGSAGASTDITITVQYTGTGNHSGKFKLSNIIYTVGSQAYGVINSAGTPSATGYFFYDADDVVIVYHETASGPAKIQYPIGYNFNENVSGAIATANLLFTLRNGSISIAVNRTT